MSMRIQATEPGGGAGSLLIWADADCESPKIMIHAVDDEEPSAEESVGVRGGRAGPGHERQTRAHAVCRRGARPGSLASWKLRLLDLPCRTPRFLRFAAPRASVACARDGSNDCVHLQGHRTDGG